MKNLLAFAAFLLTFAACQNAGTPHTGTAPVDTTATAAPAEPQQAMCFLIADGKDSTTVTLNIAANGSVSGAYDWQPWENHGAHGTISGKKDGELIKVIYDYEIEGSNQQEEMVFKLTGDQLAEGEGELVEGEGGLLKLKDPSKLTWKPFTKVACD